VDEYVRWLAALVVQARDRAESGRMVDEGEEQEQWQKH
jgi:hypothetical protein